MLNRSFSLRRTFYNAAFILIIISCNDNGVTPESIKPVNDSRVEKSTTSRTTEILLDGTEGDIISLDTAKKWIDYYTASNKEIVSSFFSARALNILMMQENSIGIRFYYAESEDGQQHLLATGTNRTGNDIDNSICFVGRLSSISLDESKSAIPVLETELDSISIDVFNSWTKNYSSKRPNEVRAHFFGYEIIRLLLSYNDCVGLRCYYALDKNAGEAKIILVGVKESGANLLPNSNSSGRTTEDGPFLADFSYPCPTLCSGN